MLARATALKLFLIFLYVFEEARLQSLASCRFMDKWKMEDFMATMTESELRAGVIFGDRHTNEYVYMPASELGVEEPICLYEYGDSREDVDLQEAAGIITRRSLRPVQHPLLGKTSC